MAFKDLLVFELECNWLVFAASGEVMMWGILHANKATEHFMLGRQHGLEKSLGDYHALDAFHIIEESSYCD